MKFSRMFLFLLLAALTGVLSACAPQASISNFPGLVLRGDKAYLSHGLQVYVLDVNSGQEPRIGDKPLRFPLESSGEINVFAPVGFADGGQIIYPNSNPSHHQVFSVNVETGAVNWAFTQSTGTWIAGPLVTKQAIYAPGGEGILYALDNSGNLLWSQKLSDYGLWSSPVSDGTFIYQTSMDGKVFALHPDSGDMAWSIEVDDVLVASPLVADGSLYVGSIGGKLYAFNSKNGVKNWETKLDGSIWSAPVMAAETLYIGTMIDITGKFYALNAADGSPKWAPQQAIGSVIASPLILDEQVIFVTDAGKVQSFNRETGVSVWQADVQGKLVTPPVATKDVILVTPMNGEYYLVAFNTNGAQKWTFKP